MKYMMSIYWNVLEADGLHFKISKDFVHIQKSP